MPITRRRFLTLAGATLGGIVLTCGGLGLWLTRAPKLEYAPSVGGGKPSEKALIIYDSVFGNTEQIAHAIGEALAAQSAVAVARVGEVKQEMLTGVQLLLVGSPTRGFRPTPAITEFLAALPALQGVRAAAFDTRLDASEIKPSVFGWIVNRGGYAETAIAKQLAARGAALAAPGAGFIVLGTEGPLKDGELARAAEWAKSLARG